MFKNKFQKRHNIVGLTIARRRKAQGISQYQLANDLEHVGLDLDKNAIQRIESGQRFVTDIELERIATHFCISVDTLIAEGRAIAANMTDNN